MSKNALTWRLTPRMAQSHAVPCPHCKARGQIGAPLLLYLPTAPLPGMHLLLLPSQPDDEDRTQDEILLAGKHVCANAWETSGKSNGPVTASPLRHPSSWRPH